MSQVENVDGDFQRKLVKGLISDVMVYFYFVKGLDQCHYDQQCEKEEEVVSGLAYY